MDGSVGPDEGRLDVAERRVNRVGACVDIG
jgi:hypothetical protein